jgi:acetyl-CoA acyltransferase
MSRRVFVVGVGMTRFEKPGKRDWDYPDMAVEAASKALDDAGVPYDAVQQAVVGYVYGMLPALAAPLCACLAALTSA